MLGETVTEHCHVWHPVHELDLVDLVLPIFQVILIERRGRF